MARVKLALIGCGGMSATHLQRFHLLSDRLRLVAAMKVDAAEGQLVEDLDNNLPQNLINAAIVCTVLPVVIIYPFLQRFSYTG